MSVNKVNPETGELVTLANGTRMWIGTKNAHDLAVQQGTMPNNCMVCITDDAVGEEAWQYSTSETRTGKTWIDGKPIYRKVIDCGNLPANTTKSLDTGITDADTLVDLHGAGNGASKIALPHSSTDGKPIQIWLSTNFGTLYVRSNATEWSSYTGCVVLEYTKTTY